MTMTAAPLGSGSTPALFAHAPLAASAAQRRFIETLLAERETTGTAYEGWVPNWSQATSKQATQVITYLKTLPKAAVASTFEPTTPVRQTPQARWDAIPVGGNGYGYYALEVDEGVIKFFRVERAAEGKWAGKTFIKEQASDAFYPIEPRQRGYAYLSEIASDHEAAGVLYGQQIGRCYRCHRTLTDESSRAAGIGPDCAGKV